MLLVRGQWTLFYLNSCSDNSRTNENKKELVKWGQNSMIINHVICEHASKCYKIFLHGPITIIYSVYLVDQYE